MKLPKNKEDLNQLYHDAESVDKELYAEMRSNVLLQAGEHYSKTVVRSPAAHVRNSARSTETMKLRLTKNLIHRVTRTYANAINEKAPGVTCTPSNETEMQDQKDAEQNKKVIDYVNRKHKMKQKKRDWVDEYITIGEVATKVFWDPNKGELLGYEQKLDDAGSPLFTTPNGEETTEPGLINPLTGEQQQFEAVPDKSLPQYSGDLCFEPLYGFNLWRDPGAKSMDESPYIGTRKMTSLGALKAQYQHDEEKMKMLKASNGRDFVVFDSSKSVYEKKEKWTLVKECYWRPCQQYPEGYFFIWTEEGILEQGTLPYGLFPIKWKAFDRYASTPRGRSIIKVVRPYQAEINRAASQRATHGITLADDKIIYQAGTTLAPGGLLPGVRGVTYQGAPPTILPGRTGDQFSGYIQEEKAEMYEAAMVAEESQTEQQNLDPYTLLFRTMGQQAKYKKYVEQFEEFLIEVYELVLELLRYYLSDQDLVRILGTKEQGNLPEFRKTTPQTFRIVVKAQSDTIDTQMGKQLTFNHLLQYIGKDLKPDQIGMIVKNMPFVNNEEMLSDLTINYENVKNDMLALERGEQPQISQYDDNEYYVQKLTHRMKQADFKYLNPQVQQMYQQFMQMHQQQITQKQEAIQQAQKDDIPVGGAMITLSMRMPSEDGKGSKQVRLPYNSVMALIERLEQQGHSLKNLEDMNSGALAEMATQMQNQQSQQMGPSNQGTMQNGYLS